jgi:hypothetical protein
MVVLADGGPREPVPPGRRFASTGACEPVGREYTPPVQPSGQSASANESDTLDGPATGAAMTCLDPSPGANGAGVCCSSSLIARTTSATSVPPLAIERDAPEHAPPVSAHPAELSEPRLSMPSEPFAAEVTPPVQPRSQSRCAFASATLDSTRRVPVEVFPVISSIASPIVEAADRALPSQAPSCREQVTVAVLALACRVPANAAVALVAVPVQPFGQSRAAVAVVRPAPPPTVVDVPLVVASQRPPVTVHATLPRAPRGAALTAASIALTSVVAVPPHVPGPPVQCRAASTVETLWWPTVVAVSVSHVPPAPCTVQLTVPELARVTSPVAVPAVAPVMPTAQVVPSQSASEPPVLFATPSRVPATTPATVVTSEPACERQSPEVIVHFDVVVVARTGTGLPATGIPRTAPRAAVSVVPWQISARQSTPASAVLDSTPFT